MLDIVNHSDSESIRRSDSEPGSISEDEDPEPFYAHHWLLLEQYDPTGLAAAIRDVSTLIRRSEIPVANVHGVPGSQPLISATQIRFNGVNRACRCCEDDFQEFEHESACRALPGDDSCDQFTFDAAQTQAEFCITNRKPYDALVGAALLALKYHLPEHFYIFSDGGWKEEWMDGASGAALSPVAIFEYIFPDLTPVTDWIYSGEPGPDPDDWMDRYLASEQRTHRIN